MLKRSSYDSSLRQEIFKHAQASNNPVDDYISFEETSRLLEEAIQRLPLQQRRVFELCKINGLSYEEAAAELNISAGTVNTHLVKSIKFLKAYLITQQIGEGHRWFDLLRTNTAIPVMNDWVKASNINIKIDQHHLLLPIPQDQINTDPSIAPNPGY